MYVAAGIQGLGAPLLWLSILLPIAAGVIAPLLRGDGRTPAAAAAVSWTASLALLLIAAASSWPRGCYDPLYGYIPGVGYMGLLMDGLSMGFAVTIAVVSLLVALYSLPYMSHRFEELGGGSFGTYYLLYQLFTAGLLGTVLSTNTIEFYLFLELTLIPSFLLIVLYGYGDRMRVGLLYLVWTHIGAELLLLGLLIQAPLTGFDVYRPGAGYLVYGAAVTPMLEAAILLILVGLAVKMALSGLHFWLPHAHAEAPTPLSALLSPLLIGIAGYGLLRLLLQVYGGTGYLHALSAPLIAWSLITIIYGGLLALRQVDVKRFLAYSSVSQMGYLALGFAAMNTWGVDGLVIHFIAHAYGKAILFGAAGFLIVYYHSRRITDYSGLALREPLLAALFLIGVMHLTGIPPACSLWSEYLLARGLAAKAVSMGAGWGGLALLVFVAGVALSTAYSFILFNKIFMGAPRSPTRRGGGGRLLLYSLLGLALTGIIVFFAVNAVATPLSIYYRVIASAWR
ncbi:MAG: NADH dehydrogenase [Crenarchaeota archaeon]|nr:NADH dehydrogenase [Thermoproteota archaeon]